MTTPARSQQKSIPYVVEFVWGEGDTQDLSGPAFLRLADWTRDEYLPTSGGALGIYQATPNLELDFPANSGFLEEEPLSMTLPKETATLFADLVAGYPHTDVVVRVHEVVRAADNTGQRLRQVFAGWVSSRVGRPDGFDELVKLEVVGIKGRIRGAVMGIQCLAGCSWPFTRGGCPIAEEDVVEGSDIFTDYHVTAIDGAKITVSNLAEAATEGYYRFGWVKRNGLPIWIRDHGTTNELTLAMEPPPEWLGNDVLTVPGCPKTIEACRTKHPTSGEAGFGGVGIMIPSRNPLIER